MKFILSLLILSLTFCLPIQKSPFDLNTGGGMAYFGLVSALTNSTIKDINDINGDGFADMVVAAPNYISTTQATDGRVYVFNGTATGISQTTADNANQILTGSAGRKFGSSVAMIDINADGFTDLVVCEFFGPGSAGIFNSAYYFLGSSAGLGGKTLIGQAITEYCRSLVVGDFNNDGYGDVVIGDASSSVDGGNGNIYIYDGSANGLNLTPRQTIALSSGTNLGLMLASGDINGDGWLDLVSSDSGASRILALHNSPSGFTNTITTSITNLNATSNIIFGDFNNDGKDDLAVACITDCIATVGVAAANEVQIFYSNGTTLNTTPNARIQKEVTGAFSPANLAVGDINLDGIPDLVVGDDKGTYPSSLLGKIYVFHGSASGICNGICSAGTLANVQITGDVTNKLGKAVGLLDLNNDGYPDLISSTVVDSAGSPRNGEVYIFNGIASGITANSVTGASQTIAGSNGEQFGTSFY